MKQCPRCGKTLSTNEIGISLRLLGRDGSRLLCRECLAAELKVEPDVIDQKIRQFKNQGCPLFV